MSVTPSQDWDGKGNGYGQVHLDVHFYTIPIEERVELMGECGVQPPGAPNCPSAIPANAPFYKLPPAAYTTGFFNQDAFFGHALPMRGARVAKGGSHRRRGYDVGSQHGGGRADRKRQRSNGRGRVDRNTAEVALDRNTAEVAWIATQQQRSRES